VLADALTIVSSPSALIIDLDVPCNPFLRENDVVAAFSAIQLVG
jgi:hypothetical protein